MHRQDVAVVRESIGKVVSMLTARRLKVTQRGTGAYVRYNRNGSIESLNVPYIPDDATPEFVASVQGFLDHEVGHVLHSDFKALEIAKKAGKRVMNLANIVEDVYIERKMTEGFAGSSYNLEQVRKFYLERIARPKIEAALAAGDVESARGYATVIAFRAWGGQTACKDFLRESVMADLVAPIAAKLGQPLMDAIGRCKNSMDCVELAKQIKGKLEEPKPKAPPLPAGEPGEPDPDEGEIDDDPREESETRTKEAKDDSGKERDERTEPAAEAEEGAGDGEHQPGESAEPEEADGDGQGEGEADDETAPEGSGGDPDKEEEVPNDDITQEGEGGGGDDDNHEEEGGGESGDPEAGMNDELGGDDETGDDTGDEGEPSKGGLDGDDEQAGLDGTHDDEGRPLTEQPEARDPSAPEEPEEVDESLSKMFDEERDFDKDMAEEISDAAKKETDEADYRIFSTEWDRIETAPPAASNKSAEKMIDAVTPMIASIARQLERAMVARSKKMWQPGLRRGRLSAGALYRTSTGDDRVFRKRFETQAVDTAVSLVVDCSGSMQYPNKIAMAGQTAYALSSVLEKLKIPNEVIGYTTREDAGLKQAIDLDGKVGYYSREEALYLPLFKRFDERLTTEAISRIAHLTENGYVDSQFEDNGCSEWLRENVDGESIAMAAHRLRSQRAERRIMIVLSDGIPACPPDPAVLAAHLKKVATNLPKTGVEVIAIGIMSAGVQRFYEKSVVLHDFGSLPTTVMKELTKLLLG